MQTHSYTVARATGSRNFGVRTRRGQARAGGGRPVVSTGMGGGWMPVFFAVSATKLSSAHFELLILCAARFCDRRRAASAVISDQWSATIISARSAISSSRVLQYSRTTPFPPIARSAARARRGSDRLRGANRDRGHQGRVAQGSATAQGDGRQCFEIARGPLQIADKAPQRPARSRISMPSSRAATRYPASCRRRGSGLLGVRCSMGGQFGDRRSEKASAAGRRRARKM